MLKRLSLQRVGLLRCGGARRGWPGRALVVFGGRDRDRAPSPLARGRWTQGAPGGWVAGCSSDAAAGVASSSSSSSSSSALAVSAEDRRLFDAYLTQLFDYNAKVNLTAVKTREEANERHIDDSLALLPVLDKYAAADAGGDGGVRVIDVGTGAGLPGVVVAVKRPEWRLTLLDSLKKRCTFLSEVQTSLGLRNVRVAWGRAEDVGQDAAHRGAYTVAMARAVAELRVLVELTVPMLAVGGYLVAAKGPNPEEEVAAAAKALETLRCKVVSIESVASFGDHGQRTAVVIQKIAETPKRFPRQAGTPKKNPL